MAMHEDDEHRIARDLKEEFDRQAIWSNTNDDFLDVFEIIAGEPKEDSGLAKGERVHLVGLFYNLRCYALRRAEDLDEEMGCVRRALTARGLHKKAATLMVQRVAEERTTNLISLADQTASMLGRGI